MDSDARHVEFEVDISDASDVRITADGCTIATQSIPDDKTVRTKMSSANIFFASFAL